MRRGGGGRLRSVDIRGALRIGDVGGLRDIDYGILVRLM